MSLSKIVGFFFKKNYFLIQNSSFKLMKNHDLHTKKLLYIILKIYYTRNYLKHVLNVSDKRQLLEYLLKHLILS